MATFVMFGSSVSSFGLQCGVLLDIDISSIAWTYHFLWICFGGNMCNTSKYTLVIFNIIRIYYE